MKKTLSAIVAILSILPFLANAQWTTGSGNINNTNSGNVGIGTTSPTAKLDVNGTINSSSYLSSTSGYYMDITSSGLNNNAGLGYLSFRSNNVDNRMVINPIGFVGIGTTAPPYNLTVIGTLGVGTSDFSIGSHTGSGLVIGPGATTGNTYTLFQSQMSGNSAAGSIVFNPYGGNVGIGTTSPDATLAVKGTIHTQEVKVDMLGWPDFVFKPTYKLPSLSEVKTYIDQNQHLPEVPSEQEVKKDGINLGEMNKLLLKKVEELTLYLIEQNKQLQEQQKITQSQNKVNQTQQEQLDQLKKQLDLLTQKKN